MSAVPCIVRLKVVRLRQVIRGTRGISMAERDEVPATLQNRNTSLSKERFARLMPRKVAVLVGLVVAPGLARQALPGRPGGLTRRSAGTERSRLSLRCRGRLD